MDYGDITIGGTGIVLLDDGSVGTPSLSFRTDQDTGLFLVGAGQIGIVCQGVEELRIQDDAGGTRATIVMNDTGAFQLARGTTAERPSSPINGMLRYNSDLDVIEGYHNSGSWTTVGGYHEEGTRASPTAISAAGGITHPDYPRMHMYVESNGGSVDITANPQITVGTNVGQELTLQGRSDANRIILEDGTGLSLNGSMTLQEDNIIMLVWDGTNWVEISRST